MNKNIVYTVDDKFVPQLATGIQSVCEHNKDVTFYVISKGISDENKERIHDFVTQKGEKVEIIELGNIRHYIDFDYDTRSWNDIVLARLFFNKILPSSLDKVLYLDGDTMVRGSLDSLWEQDMQDNVLGAVIEPTASNKIKAAIDLKPEDIYFNAGVLLIDLKKWRETEAGIRVIDFYKEHQGKLFANDQCAINGALKNEIYPLSIIYNFCNTYRFYPYRVLRKIVSPAPFISEEEYLKLKDNPVIIHFLGEQRPWRVGNRHTYTDEYLSYWNKTPWADTPLEKGWEKFFICYNIFNNIMRVAPMTRYRIMKRLIPLFIKYRKKM